MLSAAACRSRFSVVAFIASSAGLLLLLFTFSESFSSVSLDYAHKAQDYWQSATEKTSSQIYDCEDPYRRPGYLHIDHDEYRNTRWIPYTNEFLDAEAPDYAEYPVPEGKDLFFNVTDVESDFVNSRFTPRQWMHMALAEDRRRRADTPIEHNEQKAVHFYDKKDDGGLGWLWGRRVLLVGDSVDRFMIQFFCEEFGRFMQQPAAHTTATCSIPTLNLTLVHWHFAGSWTYTPEWWWMKDMKQVAFEERWDNLWAPTLDSHVRGPNGRPDLLLWQNGLWDERAMWEVGEAHYDANDTLGQRQRQLVWQEVRFVAARIKKLVQRIHQEFGADVPAMFRAITVHRESNAADSNIYELDRLSRAIAEQAGHEMFEWGRIISAFSMLYKDQTHPGKGPGSWLWGTMVMEYLARGAGMGDTLRSPYFDSWGACHAQLVNWGGR